MELQEAKEKADLKKSKMNLQSNYRSKIHSGCSAHDDFFKGNYKEWDNGAHEGIIVVIWI